MILIVTTAAHSYTHKSVRTEPQLEVHTVTYEDLQKSQKIPRATYVFTDLDRLTPLQLRHMAAVCKELRDGGCKILNDPARALGRFGLLRALNRAGINDFDIYRADALEVPRRWPVFLRLDGVHEEPVSDLLHNEDELGEALAKAIDGGCAKTALLIIEYCAEPVRGGLFRKLSAFRVGDRILGYTCVHDDKWLVKYGSEGVATPEMYEEEYDFVARNPYGEALMQAFELGGIDYGRADFGLVGGRPQIYEINTNPDIKLRPKPSSVQRRNESSQLFRKNYVDAIRALDRDYARDAARDAKGAAA